MLKWILSLCVLASSCAYAETNILAFAGSNRDGSFNKKLIIEAASIARELGARVTVIDLKDFPIPIYNGDEEVTHGMPAKAKELRKLMIQSDAIIIASPEYNASLTGLLKNDLDWVSRSEDGKSSREAFAGKKFALLSTSPGQGGGARGLAHLRAIIQGIGGTVLEQQVTVPNAYNAFDAAGHLKNEQARQELKQVIGQLIH